MAQSDFPATRACLFDMDGLLLDSEDIITASMNEVLAEYGKPAVTRSIRVQLMGVPDSTNGDTFHNWANLSIPREQWNREIREKMSKRFAECMPLPGAQMVLSNLGRARCGQDGGKIELALASSSKTQSYEVKTSRAESKRLLSSFQPHRRILGDDPRVPKGRGKPAPDIYLLALQLVNSTLDSGEKPIMPNECLVFEDSVAGLESGRRAGMRVVWVPHPDVATEFEKTGQRVQTATNGPVDFEKAWQLGEADDGWVEIIPTLEHFDYQKYGIHLLD